MSQDKLITALERHAERFRDLNRLQKELEGLPNRIENLNRQIDAEEQELVKEMKVCKRDKLCKQRVMTKSLSRKFPYETIYFVDYYGSIGLSC
jgi:hypothetical protein